MTSYFVAIDLKSFYASAECVARGLDPLSTNLVVADITRTEKTICLAVSPSLKAVGIPGRPRLFEVVEKVRVENNRRRRLAKDHVFMGKSVHAPELAAHPEYELDYIVAPPRMARYMELSTEIFNIYRRYVSEEDIVVYSVDEVFIDVTHYLSVNRTTPREMAMKMIRDVLKETGITATAGIGTNLYLAKIAMDIEAKHMPPDEDGVRLAELDERTYREKLWEHTPLTDFWRVGRGTAKKLESHYMKTMGDVALMSLRDEDLLYRLFGVNAELLIDHAWGYEPTEVKDIKAYRPSTNSISTGQVLSRPYENAEAEVIVREMAQGLSLDLVAKHAVTDRIELVIVYDSENLSRPEIVSHYHGAVETDHYGRQMPKAAHGFFKFDRPTSSMKRIVSGFVTVFYEKADPMLWVRRVYVIACNLAPEKAEDEEKPMQLDLFTPIEQIEEKEHAERELREKEKHAQKVMLEIREKYGKNALLKGTSFLPNATGRERNGTIGGHKAEGRE